VITSILVFLSLLLAGAAHAQTPAGLVAAYGFDEGTGTAIRDASGLNNNGTASGTTWTTGKFGNALVFNGTSAQVTVPNAASLQLTTGMTLEAWVFPTTAPIGWRALVDKNVDGYYLMASTDNGNRPGVGGTWTDGNKNVFGTAVLPVNTWTHLASTFDGSTVRLFVNGVQVASQAQTAAFQTTTATLQIGADAYTTEYFAGLIDEVRVYNRALSAAEIQADMATPVSSVTPPPPVGDTTPPSAPGALTATASGSTQINLSWGAATDNVGVTGYSVERCQGSGCTAFTQVFTLTGTTFSNTGLTAGTTYSYRVRATDAAGNFGGYSNVASASTPTPDTTPPGAPPTLSATAASATQINLSWTAATDDVGVTGYRMERCQGSGCTTFAQIFTLTGTTFNNTGLTASTSYSYRVRAVDAAGNLGAYSSIATATTLAVADTAAPSAPTALSAKAAGTQVDLAWTASTDNVGVASYQILRCTGSTCTTFAQVGTSTVPSFSNTGLAASTTYRYRVRAVDGAGNVSGNSNTVNATTGTAPDTTAPSAPASLVATASSQSQINLTWSAATDNVGVLGYQLERCSGSGCSAFAQIAAPAGTSFNDTGLTASTSYSYRVRALDAAGNLGGYSPIASATTPAPDTTAPTIPTGLTATAVSASQVNLGWNASTDNVAVTGYILQRCQGDGCSTWATIATPTGTVYSDTGLAASTTYNYWVRATDAAGNLSPWSSIVSVTTLARNTAGLVAAYGFDEGAGTAIRDASGQNNNGTASGTTWTTGKFGSALVFNGTNAQVTIPNAASLQLTTGMTLEAWVFPTTAPTGWRAIVDMNVDGYYIMASTDNGNRPGVGGTWTDGNKNLFGTAVLPVNTWTHLAATFDSSTTRLYVNGVQVASQAQTAPLQITTATLQVGGDAYVGENFAGLIDEVRIYNRALSAAEVQADMVAPVGAGGGTPPPPPPPNDTVAPTINLTSPLAGTTVSNTVSVSANATDDVGVASVQFLLDNAPLGSPVTSAPYSVAWDTSTAVPGSHVLQGRATDFAGNSTTSASVAVTVSASGGSGGSTSGVWGAPITTPIVMVHANLLPTGEVLTWDGDVNGHNALVWNTATGAFTSVPNTLTNMFCSGHCLLSDGRVIVTGGHLSSHVGLRDTNTFDPVTRAWTRVAPMVEARWYPTATALPDGRVLVTSGENGCNGCVVDTPEIYDPQLDSWTALTRATLSLPFYPHMFVLPDGRVLAAATSGNPIVSRVLDIPTQTWSVVDPTAVDGGSSVMYAPGKIMKAGRSADPEQPEIPSTTATFVLDMTQPTPRWRPTPPMAFPRAYHTLTLLPDGTVLATGGSPDTNELNVDNAVLAAEVWSPVTETWTTLASMSRPRLYHSTALLLPDATVVVMGGGRLASTDQPTDQFSAQVFSPPYLFKGARPVITSAPATAAYGASISVQTPDAASIGSVSLVRLGSATHAFNTNQRILQLPFTAGAGTLSVQTPANANLAPPGYYMLFILNANGVPSVASMVQLR